MFVRAWRWVAGLAICAVVTGCTGADPEPTPSPTASPTQAPTEDPEPVTLRFAVYGDEQRVEVFQEIADAYAAENPDITFELTSTGDAAAAGESALGAIASGIDPPDVFLLDVDYLPAAVEAEALEPVDLLMEDRGVSFGDGIQRSSLNAFAANDRLACMPYDASPRVAFWNTDLINPRRIEREAEDDDLDLAEGWNWDLLRSAAEQAAAKGAAGVYVPPDLVELMPFLFSAGASVVDDDRDPNTLELSDGDVREALVEMAALTRDRELALHPRAVERKSALDRFVDGELGVLFGTRALVPALRAAEGLSFDAAPLPRINSTATTAVMSAYCIAATSEHVEDVADFIAFAVNGEGVRIAAESGGIVPTSLDTLFDPAFVQLGLQPANTEVFVEGSRRARPTPYSPRWLAAAASVTDGLRTILYKRGFDVTSADSPELEALLEQADTSSELIFDPPEPTPTPTP